MRWSLPSRRRAVGAAFVALAGAGFALPVACAPTPTASCDLERLRHYPLTMVVENRALPLRMPDVFFPDPAGRDPGLDRDSLDAAGAAKLRAALERGLAGFRPGERPVLMLAAFDHWTAQGTGLKGFFVLPEGVFLDDVLETLDEAGLSEHAALMREGAALFGPRYGTQAERYARWSDGGGEIRDAALDAALDRLAERFRALPRPLDEAVRRVERSPDLAASYETLRAGTDADDRLRFLTGGLWRCLDHYGTPAAVAARLAALPTAHGRIIVTEIFQAEMLNGSVHQFFFNSSGGLAPDVADALDAMDLPGHAAALRRGIATFPSPFPRDLNTRRAFMARQDKAFDDALYELTGDVDDGKMQEAMVRIAREADILPR